MGILVFEAKEASVKFGMTSEGAQLKYIELSLKLREGDDVQASNGKSLKNIEWFISINEGLTFNERASKEGVIGYLSHIRESDSDVYYSESCCAALVIEPSIFTIAWNLVTNGKLPALLSLNVKDINYRGFDIVWDIENNKSIGITEISFKFPVARLN